ncbi:DNA cytosine methyltransferase [Peribacillus butanolivorans]
MYSEPRSLTNRERALLQTFPDGFKSYGRRESVRKQIHLLILLGVSSS